MLRKLQATILNSSLHRFNIKLSQGVSGFKRHAILILEEQVSINASVTEFEYLKVGAYSYIRSGSELLNVAAIGRFCSIGNEVVLGQNARSHPIDWVSTGCLQNDALNQELEDPAQTVIGNDVWIGREAMIMKGLSIGTGAIIGARSVVTRDVPAYAIVVGVPARIVKYRHTPETVARLLCSKWWEVDPEVLKRLPSNDPDKFLEEISSVNRPSAYRKVSLTRDTWRISS
ncbi:MULTISPECIES: CatB-related O-acetyltransferase [Candidatus Accumulibacter]|nr:MULTISPECIES: CatB-related O-acetyltransferase [Candidatus Accumulibacter]